MTHLSHLISITAAGKPDKIALFFENENITYRDLERRSNQLARRLVRDGVKPGMQIGICVERSIEMVVGLLGILKTGAAYIPLDPAYPADRISYMLEDSQTPLVLTQQSLRGTIPVGKTHTLCLDSDWDVISRESELPLDVKIDPEDLAYVIYTSGSTGRPKGVEIPHRAVVNFLESMSKEPGLTAADRLLAVTTLSFDIAGLELYLPLVVGAQVVIASRTMAVDGARLIQEIAAQKISTMQATPATWRLMLDAGWSGSPDMRIFCGGETLTRDLAEQLLPRCKELWNLYGPTETTIWSTLSRVESGEGPVSIGHPIQNTEIHILDDNMTRVDAGTPGELYIGGDGLARGYFKRAELTSERFVPHPIDSAPGARLYRTGDLVKLRADNSLEHMGRVDFQVKIRGFRIELGEIEAALETAPEVQQAVVLAREDIPGDKRLVAYIIAAAHADPNVRGLRNALATILPDYMVPGIYMTLKEFPLTPNGKVDRNAFPTPDRNRPELANEYLAPNTEIEKKLVAIWIDVLRLERIGINDNFFDLGGDSLKVAQVANRIRDDFEVEIAPRTVFENPTVGSLAKAISTSTARAQKFDELPINTVKRGTHIPLSFAQERVWFIHQVNPENLAYNFISKVDFTGPLNRAALERALGEILRRHESYRTSFPTIDGQPVQIVHPAEPYFLPIIDLSEKSEAEQEVAFDQWSAKEFEHRFDLAKLPLVRWHLIKYGDDKNALIHMEHHLVHDGWSFNIFLVELVELYQAYAAGENSPLAELPIQFAEFATWQKTWMQGEISEHQLNYWRKKFESIPPVLELPVKGPRPSTETFKGTSLRPELPLKLCNDLRSLSRKEGSTLFMTMLSGFIALLHRYTGETDIAVGTFFANRRARESEGLIGMILNNVVIRSALDTNPSAREFIGLTRDTVLDDANYQDVPFDRVVNAVQPKRDMSTNPLFQVMFSFHDEPMPDREVPGLDIKITPVISNGSSKFDLGVIGIPHSAQVVGLSQGSEQDGLTMLWEFNTDLFEPDTIKRMIQHYISLLCDMVDNPDKRISELDISTSGEMQQSLENWNDTKTEAFTEQCLHQLFEAQAVKTPDATAVIYQGEKLSYEELDSKANQLANLIQEQGLMANGLVGVCLERSERMLVSLLAVLKAGGTYVPMDPAFPADRLQYMVDDAGIKVIVTEGDICDCLGTDKVQLIRLDQQAQALSAQSASLSKTAATLPGDLAYIIYTSGSTGRPKGVQISHRAVVNFLLSMAREPGINVDDRLYAVTTISFDIAGLELYLPLIVGAQVIIGPRTAVVDGEELAAQLATTGATIMQATPTTWQLLLDAGWQGNNSLKALCGGEAFPQSLAAELLPKVGSLWNMYGPTETTIWSIIHKVESTGHSLPIGRPIANTEIYLLDSYDNPVPVGIIGELCIGGIGLANGYLNQPELTAEKFASNPIKWPGACEKIYRTGDLARYRPDGVLECLGRTDQQIKLRGYRIELGEIEALLDKIQGVRQSVVIAREDQPGNKRLVAYIVGTGQVKLSVDVIMSRLRENLPDYMMPSVCVTLDELPLTPNGKVDRLALPAPSNERQEKGAGFLAPRTVLEKKLAEIWEDLLGVSPVGVRDDFFDVGGHSLLAVRLVAEIEVKTNNRITIAALLQGRTIEYVANKISDAEIAQDPEGGIIALRTKGDKSPFFAIGSHPRYVEIAKHLDDQQPVYQLDMYALLTQRQSAGQKPFRTIEAYADYYLKQIKRIKPQGPYKIGGGCEGAYLAYEIAVRLQQQGDAVESLIMWIPPALRESKGQSLRRFAVWLTAFRLKHLITSGTFHNISKQELKILFAHERLEYYIQQAICAYAPTASFDGEILIIRTEEAPFEWKNDINQEWIKRASGGAQVHVVRGHHGNWLYDYFDDLMQVIKSRL